MTPQQLADLALAADRNARALAMAGHYAEAAEQATERDRLCRAFRGEPCGEPTTEGSAPRRSAEMVLRSALQAALCQLGWRRARAR